MRLDCQKCGDKKLTGTEADDKLFCDGPKGCTSSCSIDKIYTCLKAWNTTGKHYYSDCGIKAGVCGNGMYEPPYEHCDDGNFKNGDGCSINCQKEGSQTTCRNEINKKSVCTYCGDGIVQTGEICDRGGLNGVSGSGCNTLCDPEVVVQKPPKAGISTGVQTNP